MRKFGRLLLSFIFWSYERGSIQYDIAVVLIVIFVLASPRHWFHDRPQEPQPKLAGVVLLSTDAVSGVQTYRVDSNVLAYPIPETELEHLIHDAVRKNAPGMQGKQFHIVGMKPIFNDSGQVISYEVAVQP